MATEIDLGWARINVSPSAVVDGGSGLLLFALGAFLALSHARRRGAIALGVFMAAFGAGYVGDNFVGGSARDVALVIDALSFGIATIALGAIAVRLPTPLARGDRAAVLAASAVLVVGLVICVLRFVDEDFPPGTALGRSPSGLRYLLLAVLAAGQFAFAALLASRAASGNLPGQDARRAAYLALAVGLFPAFLVGVSQTRPEGLATSGIDFIVSKATVLVVVTLAILWLRVAARGVAPRASRNFALGVLAIMLAGQILGTLFPTSEAPGSNGMVRIAGAATLAYAVARQGLLGASS